MHKLDIIDRKLVGLLQQDGRLTNAEIAERIGLSQSACHRRVKRLEETGVISGYGAFVDRKRVGLNVMGYIFVKMESHAESLLDVFIRGVEEMDEIVACHAISGGGDYLLTVVAADMDAYADFALKKLAKLPGIKDSESNFVLSTIKLDPAWSI